MAQVAAGDSLALGTLYDRYAASVYALGLRILNDRQQAEELVQETFLRVWRQAASYRGERGAPATWILGIARNLTIDELRRRGARPQPSDGDPEAQLALIASGEDDPAEQADARLRHEMVARALSQLPPEQREALELAYFNGLSQSEIAARLGAPLGTIKTRMRLGLRRLKGLLGPRETSREMP